MTRATAAPMFRTTRAIKAPNALVAAPTHDKGRMKAMKIMLGQGRKVATSWRGEDEYAELSMHLCKTIEKKRATMWPADGKNQFQPTPEIAEAIMECDWHHVTAADIARKVSALLGREITGEVISQRMRGELRQRVKMAMQRSRKNYWEKVVA